MRASRLEMVGLGVFESSVNGRVPVPVSGRGFVRIPVQDLVR